MLNSQVVTEFRSSDPLERHHRADGQEILVDGMVYLKSTCQGKDGMEVWLETNGRLKAINSFPVQQEELRLSVGLPL